ncbi:MAG: hypothetical protein NZV14_03700 [Bryobacteraceae bacterium]|nr:hypothetical protein [Bryobacteraceae bacterium]MDW8377241.1 hypothetical protein [Bryobacterales bacterium]
MHRRLLVCALALMLLAGCSSAPPPPAKGTPAFYWQAAQETFAAGDYRKANDHLEQLTKTNNEFSDRGLAWRLVVCSGLLRGALDFAEKFEFGARENKANPTPFRKQVNDMRSLAANYAAQLLETWRKMKAASLAEVSLDFPFPAGNTAEVPALVQVSRGILIPPAEIDSAMKLAFQRGLVLATTKAAGAEDAAEARSRFATRPVKVPGPAFRLAVAESLYEASTLFDSRRLDRPDVMKTLLSEAEAALSEAPEGKRKKDLANKIQEALRKSSRKS